jgi:pyruvate dehydrogenase E2 component (dihydrolipoamide acetyltransferase)
MSKEITVPDIGTTSGATVIEVAVKAGDEIQAEQTLITLESEKASMEIPSSEAGLVDSVAVKVGDKIKTGDIILTLKASEKVSDEKEKIKPAPTKEIQPAQFSPKELPEEKTIPASADKIYASPAVRRLARELNIDLGSIAGTGRKARIQKEDLLHTIKTAMQSGGGQGSALPSAPAVDFKQFGEIELKPLNKIKKLTAINLHRNWLLVPHVTQCDEADITELEAFRKDQAEKGHKLTPLVFIIKAVVAAMKQFPQFNASLDAAGENLIFKKYFHIGVAVDTPEGLVVPVIREADKKSLLDLAQELQEVSQKARNKQLLPKDMQGSCFTISSLGGIGGTLFTPIVNLPDAAILGVSKSQIKPVYQEGEFVPRLMLPLSLSYDHRIIDGAEGARFIVQLGKYLSDIRQLLM